MKDQYHHCLRLLLMCGLLIPGLAGFSQSQPEAATKDALQQRGTHAAAPKLRAPAKPPRGTTFTERWLDSLMATPDMPFANGFQKLGTIAKSKSTKNEGLLIAGLIVLGIGGIGFLLGLRAFRVADLNQNYNGIISAYFLMLAGIIFGIVGFALTLAGLLIIQR